MKDSQPIPTMTADDAQTSSPATDSSQSLDSVDTANAQPLPTMKAIETPTPSHEAETPKNGENDDSQPPSATQASEAPTPAAETESPQSIGDGEAKNASATPGAKAAESHAAKPAMPSIQPLHPDETRNGRIIPGMKLGDSRALPPAAQSLPLSKTSKSNGSHSMFCALPPVDKIISTAPDGSHPSIPGIMAIDPPKPSDSSADGAYRSIPAIKAIEPPKPADAPADASKTSDPNSDDATQSGSVPDDSVNPGAPSNEEKEQKDDSAIADFANISFKALDVPTTQNDTAALDPSSEPEEQKPAPTAVAAPALNLNKPCIKLINDFPGIPDKCDIPLVLSESKQTLPSQSPVKSSQALRQAVSTLSNDVELSHEKSQDAKNIGLQTPNDADAEPTPSAPSVQEDNSPKPSQADELPKDDAGKDTDGNAISEEDVVTGDIEISDVVCAIADLPTQMLQAVSEDDVNDADRRFGDSDDDRDDFDAIAPPDMPPPPNVPPSEFERTIVFEHSENRWDDADSNALPQPGDTVGNYRIIDMLGKGGFGAVYRAQNLTLGREEALKLILPSAKTECDDIDKRFEREVDIVSRLEHPNIVRLYCSGRLPHNLIWMTMELIRGTRLDKRIKKGALSFARAKSIMLQVLSGLMEAHRRQIVHRDLKPANIMLANKEGYDDQVSILDFGLSKAIGSAEDVAVQELTLADSRRVYGTPQYMAPEQLNHGHLGPWTDVYAAGLIFCEMLTGHPAVTGDSLFEIAYKQSYEQLQLPTTMYGTAVEAVIMRACHKNPAQRYAHAGEFLHALERIKTPDDPPSVLANYQPATDEPFNLSDTGKKTRIAMPAIQPETSNRAKDERRCAAQSACFYINIIAYPLAVVAIAIILCAVFGIINISH